MANWQGFTLTEKGLALQAKIDAGLATLKFTKISIGSGSSSSNNSALTDLVKREKDLKITSCSADGNIVKLVYILTNEGVTQKFKEREMGLFAKDPDDGEIMFAYMIDSDPDTMPAEGSTTVVAKRTTLNLTFSNTGNVSAYLDSTGFISWGDTITGKSDTATADDNDRHIPSTSWVHKKFENLKSSYVKGITGSNDTLTVTKGNGSSSKITINNVAKASAADTANAVKAYNDGQIKYDLSQRPDGSDTNILYNWTAGDSSSRKITGYKFYDGKGTGTFSDLYARYYYGNLKGNADTSSLANSIAITRGNEIVLTGIPNNQEQVWLGYRSEGYMGSPIKKWKFGDLKLGLAAVEASEFIGPAKVLKGIYTQNGGKQPLGYFGRNTVGALMSNESVMGDTSYKNWLYMDHYEGSDAGGATAFGISRTGTRAFIMRSGADRGAIIDSAELLTTKGGHTVSGSMTFNGTVTTKSGIIIPTRSRGDNTTYAASTAFVQDAINALVNGSPGALDTLKELAAALGNDANFAATITKALGLKAPLASPSFTGTVTGPTPSTSANNTQFATTAWVLQSIAANATGPIIGDVSSANGWWIKIPCKGFNLLIQGGTAIVKANGGGPMTLPVSFAKSYTPYASICWDDNHQPNINMMCAYAGVHDNAHIYLTTDIIRNEDIGIPLTVFWLAVGL